MSHSDDNSFHVVVNHEEQYSIWTTDEDPPNGWTNVGDPGSREDCLDWIEANWTDITPLSVRRQLAR